MHLRDALRKSPDLARQTILTVSDLSSEKRDVGSAPLSLSDSPQSFRCCRKRQSAFNKGNERGASSREAIQSDVATVSSLQLERIQQMQFKRNSSNTFQSVRLSLVDRLRNFNYYIVRK